MSDLVKLLDWLEKNDSEPFVVWNTYVVKKQIFDILTISKNALTEKLEATIKSEDLKYIEWLSEWERLLIDINKGFNYSNLKEYLFYNWNQGRTFTPGLVDWNTFRIILWFKDRYAIESAKFMKDITKMHIIKKEYLNRAELMK